MLLLSQQGYVKVYLDQIVVEQSVNDHDVHVLLEAAVEYDCLVVEVDVLDDEVHDSLDVRSLLDHVQNYVIFTLRFRNLL